MGDIESPDDLHSIYCLAEAGREVPQLGFRVPDRLDVSLEAREVRAQDGIDGGGVREVVGFQHLDQEVHGRPLLGVLGSQDRVQGVTVSLEDVSCQRCALVLEVIHQHHEGPYTR